ncbi:hypothetical protein [Acidisphaera sp. L21]|uniref:hypothetical protein n=1 Tax=Acidisphaera sp. L21 TaxID=1641851 RepID=UPI00131ADD5C|nr:hypothetical protein [Acidisphaera sp. L21]
MSRSSATEETPSTPGWVDGSIREIFAPYGQSVEAARDMYAECLAGVRGAVDMDLGHDRCRQTLLGAVAKMIEDPTELDHALQALEAKISEEA